MKNTHTFYKNTFTPGFRVKPVIINSYLTTEIKIIFKDNKGKSGIYRLTNSITGATYVGSAVNLTLGCVITFLLNFFNNKY